MLILAVSIVALILGITACGAIDDPFSVEVVNDTTQTVVAHPFFGAAYGATDASDNGQVVTVKPGQSFGRVPERREGEALWYFEASG